MKKLNSEIKIFETPQELAEEFAAGLTDRFRMAVMKRTVFTVALSGGSTPGILYSVLAEKYNNSVDWRYIHFFWGDERCVPPDDLESNYGMAYSKFLSKIDIPQKNIHRIFGEDQPEQEAVRYAVEIMKNTRKHKGLPMFDQVILGMGEDGHMVSIFPSNRELLDTEKICEVAVHPLTGQKRVTITGKVINNSALVTFLVTGASKAVTLGKVFKKDPEFPASSVMPFDGTLTWMIDRKAGSFIK